MVAGLAWRNNASFESFTSFNPDTFFEVFLPPIIFNAGYTLELNHGYYFFINIGTIFILAYVGTIISTAVIAMLCYLVAVQTNVTDLSLLGMFSFVIQPPKGREEKKKMPKRECKVGFTVFGRFCCRLIHLFSWLVDWGNRVLDICSNCQRC